MSINNTDIHRFSSTGRFAHAITASDQRAMLTRQALAEVQQTVDRLMTNEHEADAWLRLNQVQIFIHEALIVIADE